MKTSIADNSELIDDAIDCVKQEERDLQEEAKAFKSFGTIVGHIPPSKSKNPPPKMEEIQQAYRDQVFEPLNYGNTYDESWQESLKIEFNPKTRRDNNR
jgi:hypothetical protein